MVNQFFETINSIFTSNVTLVGICGAYAAMVGATGWKLHRLGKHRKACLDDLAKQYREGMSREELIEFNERLRKHYWVKGYKELKQKVDSQLEPIVENEIRESVASMEKLDPKINLGMLSDTYRQVYCKR